MKALIVTAPFASYAKGDQIVDAEQIASALENNPANVVAVDLPETSGPVSKDTAKDTPQA